MTHGQIQRFAVAVFDSWDAVHRVARDLSNGFALPHNMSCVGLERVLAHRDDAGPAFDAGILNQIPFPGETERVYCSVGPIAERLEKRAAAGEPSLQAALGHWLIARHAAQLAEAAHRGKIIVFVQLFNDDDERRAYRCLLAQSSCSVGVHDLIGN